MSAASNRVFIIDAVGFDRRNINAKDTPFSHWLFENFQHQLMDGQPTTEVWPSLVCGVNPGVEGHLLWHARMRDRVEDSLLGRFVNTLPNWLVSSVQLVPFFFLRHAYDVPAMPRWRRHQLEFHRLKYNLRWKDKQKYHVVGGAKSMFHTLGDDSTYRVTDRFAEFDEMVQIYPTQHRLQMLEIHAFDLLSHWYLDKPEVIAEHMNQMDRCMEGIYKKCKEQGVTFVLLIEHGQELVRKQDHINLQKVVHDTGVRRNEICYYNGVAVARFWFKNDSARQKVTEAVKQIPKVQVKSWREMNESYNFTLTPEWGELYVICEPGNLFHPHDYYQPLGSLFVGLTQKAMRQRMFDYYHKGYHGHVPGSPSENAYSIVADERVRPTASKARMMDFAPSMLHLLGVETPEYMQGRPTFEYVQDPVSAADTPIPSNR